MIPTPPRAIRSSWCTTWRACARTCAGARKRSACSVRSAGGGRRVDDALGGQVSRPGQPVLLQSHADTGPLKVQTGFMVQSLIKVPVRKRQEVVGGLGGYNRLGAGSFYQHHVT